MVDVDWDSKDEDTGSGIPVAGVYKFKITECTEGSSASGGYLQLVCENLDKPKWKLRERLYFTPKAMRFTKARLKGLGVPQGLTPLKPHYLVGTIFEAICKAEVGKPNAEGKTFTNLQVDVFADMGGYSGGIALIERSVNMPKKSVATPEEEDDSSAPF